jgi:hypothetical protein
LAFGMADSINAVSWTLDLGPSAKV